MVLTELIFNSFSFGRVFWSLKNWYLTVSTLRGCDGLKELIFSIFYFGRVCWSWQNCFFSQFLLWEGVVVLKELICYSFYFGRVWWFWKTWFLAVSHLGGCGGLDRTAFFTVSTLGGCGGLERSDLLQFPLWEGVVVLKDLSFSSFYFGRVWWSWKNWFFIVSHLGGCGGLERTDF